MLFVLLGLSPGTDILAHLGGFLAGMVFGWMLAHCPNLTRSRRANIAAGLLAALIVIIPWWAAFRTLPPP
jgi:membrane associated rhomboid family serine protease